jgi:putative transposase
MEQALYDRETDGTLVHHSDHSVRYLSIRYRERLAEAGIEPSVGSRGDSYANALTNQRIGLEETDDGLWSIYVHSVLLATFDERDYIIQS